VKTSAPEAWAILNVGAAEGCYAIDSPGAIHKAVIGFEMEIQGQQAFRGDDRTKRCR
jgi:hypothetical protein